MKTYFECFPCFLRQALNIAELTGCASALKKRIMNDVMAELMKAEYSSPPPFIFSKINDVITKITKKADPYKKIKKQSNDTALKYYGFMESYVKKHKDKLKTAFKAAAFGNVIDFGPYSGVDIEKEIKNLKKSSISHPALPYFSKIIKKARKLLILGDNAGEIVFDKVLIKLLKKEYKNLEIYYSVRRKPALNDSTLNDAVYTGLDKICRVVEAGRSPGIDPDDASKEFLKIFKEADIILSKGQGNYETLSSFEKLTKAEIFYLLKVKCGVIARHINYPAGSLVFIRAKKNKRGVKSGKSK